MGIKGGARPGAGRKKGSKSAATKKRDEVAARALDTGLTPLDYMLHVMRDPTADESRRDDMAKGAAPYVHSRLAPKGQDGKDWKPVDLHWTVTIVDPKRA